MAQSDVEVLPPEKFPKQFKKFFGLPAIGWKHVPPYLRRQVSLSSVGPPFKVVLMGWNWALALIQACHGNLGRLCPERPTGLKDKDTASPTDWSSCTNLLQGPSGCDRLLCDRGVTTDVLLTDSGLRIATSSGDETTRLREFEIRNGKRWHFTEFKFWEPAAVLEATLMPGTTWRGHQLGLLLGHTTSALLLRKEMPPICRRFTVLLRTMNTNACLNLNDKA